MGPIHRGVETTTTEHATTEVTAAATASTTTSSSLRHARPRVRSLGPPVAGVRTVLALTRVAFLPARHWGGYRSAVGISPVAPASAATAVTAVTAATSAATLGVGLEHFEFVSA